MNYVFDFKNKEVLNNIRSPHVWQFNLAMNMALLSNDANVIKQFFRNDAATILDKSYLPVDLNNMFLGKNIRGQAFTYFGICPMIVNGVQNLVASSGFCCESNDKEIDNKLNKCIEKNSLQSLFSQGVYYESGLGDFLYRISYCPEISNRPIIEIIEPQYIQVKYKRGKPVSFLIKEVSDIEPGLECHEIYSKNNNGLVVIDHFLFKDKEYISKSNNPDYYEQCLKTLHLTAEDMKQVILPLKEFPIIYKQNHVQNIVYKGQRGVPDIQGLYNIEDSLSESISDFMDAIRKGGIKEFVDDSLLESDEEGNIKNYDPFNKTIIKTKGNSLSNKNLVEVVQADIKWQAYIESCKYLISTALNKAGISPTTIGITGLESINSSQESQDAREKPSLRKREESLKTWKTTLEDLLNRYLQMCDYIDGEEIGDYSSLIHIKFNKYVNPTQDSIISLIGQKIEMGLASRKDGIKELDPTLSDEQAEKKLFEVVQEEQMIASKLPVLADNPPTGALNEGESTTTLNAETKPTVAINEGEKL